MTRNPFPPKRSFGPWRSFLQVLASLPLLAAAPATAQANPFDATWPNTDFSRLAIDLAMVSRRSSTPASSELPRRRGSMTANL